MGTLRSLQAFNNCHAINRLQTSVEYPHVVRLINVRPRPWNCKRDMRRPISNRHGVWDLKHMQIGLSYH